MARMLRGLYTNPKLVWRIARPLLRYPRVTRTMIECYFLGTLVGLAVPIGGTWRRPADETAAAHVATQPGRAHAHAVNSEGLPRCDSIGCQANEEGRRARQRAPGSLLPACES